MKRRVKFALLSLLLIFIAGIIFIPRISIFLSKSNPVKANILLVEGWMPPINIEQAYSEFRNKPYDFIITTGLRENDYFTLYKNGLLIFYLDKYKKEFREKGYGKHVIEIEAYSELGGNDKAHFNVMLNDSSKGSFFAERMKKRYHVYWTGDLSTLDSLCVQFDNDQKDEFGDRNLYVKGIIFDNNTMVEYSNNSIYQIAHRGSVIRFSNNFNSYAELAKNELIELGLDSARIIAIPAIRVSVNRTLSSVLAVKNYLQENALKVEGLNIISIGVHGRRTWMTYSHFFGNQFPVGIIALPDYKSNRSRIFSSLRTMRESLGIIYYWFVLKFYN